MTSLLSSFLLGAVDPKALNFQEKREIQVGDREIITTTDVELMIDSLRQRFPKDSQQQIRQKAVEVLIDQSLIAQYLDKFGFGVTEMDAKRRLYDMIGGEENLPKFRAQLDEKGQTLERFLAGLKKDLERQQFRGLMLRSINRPGDPELISFYKNNAASFQQNKEVELLECILPGTDREKAEEKALSFVKNPKTFSKCIAMSIAPSAQDGGKLGKFTRTQLSKEFASKIFNLKEGEVAVFPLGPNIQLLKVAKIRNLGTLSFDQAKDQIREQLENELIEKESEKTLRKLRSETFVKIFT